MDEDARAKLFDDASNVLRGNDKGQWTIPQPNLYPHQWLWDSCFIAIGLRHVQVERAKTELQSLLRGQWHNGMIPHLIFSDHSRPSQKLEQAWMNPNMPTGIITSGLTQPPMLAEAVWQVGQKLRQAERRSWFKQMLPHLISHHTWLYAERNAGSGLIVLIHPYESGLDNTPPSIQEVRAHAWPWWLKLLEASHLTEAAKLLRRDTRYVSPAQRMSNAEAIAYFALAARLRRQGFDIKTIVKRPRFAVVDLAFNCIFIRANQRLVQIAQTAGQPLSTKLVKNIQQTENALEGLWDEASGQYFSGSLIGKHLIEESTVAALLPLYAGCISKDRAERLVQLYNRQRQFATKFPVPSVPQTSSFFNPIKYWQGPVWVNTNWLVIDGLARNGFKAEAAELKNQTLNMIAKNGIVDYYNPLTGEAVGAPGFSWTAALAIDLLKS